MNIFIDTNIYLSLYHFSKDDLEKLEILVKLVNDGEIKLFYSDQINDEYKRNRERRILEANSGFSKSVKIEIPQIIKDYNEFKNLKDLQKDINKEINVLSKKLLNDAKNFNLKADKVISNLFDVAILLKTNIDIHNLAKLRVEKGNPPGKDNSIGDAINWELLLSDFPDEDLIFISDDKDFKSLLDEKQMKSFLTNEWKDNKQSDIEYFHSISDFLKKYYKDIKLSTELEKDNLINNLSMSDCFATTHNYISKLTNHTEYTASQANEIVRSALSNRQIYWIICDSDVFEFVSNIIKKYKTVIEDELLKEIIEYLDSCKEEDDE